MSRRWRWSEAGGGACPLSAAAKARPKASAPDVRPLLYKLNDNTCLYGIFDVHNGDDTTPFIIQEIANEILHGQLNDRLSDEEIKDVLRNAFLSVEKAYIESISALVVERTKLQYELPEELDREKFNKSYANILDRLKEIDRQLSIGVTSVIALVHKEKLFVANIGNGRALLCKTDDNCVLRVVQLSVDHSLNNEDELLRLSQLGLNIDKIRKGEMLGNLCSTRCLGNYLVKYLYQSFPDLSSATDAPVIAIPEVHGPIDLDQSCRFLVLLSDELYKNLQESSETEQVNKQFVQIIVEQFRIEKSMEAVCQAVVDKTMRLYHEHCVHFSKSPWRNSRNTLLIRNFNFPLPNRVISSTAVKKPNSLENTINFADNNNMSVMKGDSSESKVRFNPIVESRSPITTNEESDIDNCTNGGSDIQDMSSYTNTNSNKENESQFDENLKSTMMSEFSQNSNFTNSGLSTYPNSVNKMCNENKKIQAYVDFSQYYQNIEKAKLEGTLPNNFKFD